MYICEHIYPDIHMHIPSSYHFVPCEKSRLKEDTWLHFVEPLTPEVSTNLRASNYDIKHTERSTVKVTAGRIIPALVVASADCRTGLLQTTEKNRYPEATTTAMICGLVDVEFLKLVLGTGWRRDFNAEALNPFGDGSNRLYQFMPCCRMNMSYCFWFHRGRGFWPIAISVH